MAAAQPGHRSRGGRASFGDLEIASKLKQGFRRRNALRRLPLSAIIRRKLDNDSLSFATAKREAIARAAIGLAPLSTGLAELMEVPRW